jgi:hypothetical protein
MAVFTVDEVLALTSTDLNLFFPVGLPEGHELVRAGITVEPKLMMVSPNVGTPGSTLIRATVPGVGTSLEGLDLVDGSGRTICLDDARIVSYGVLECWTRRDDMGADAFEVKLKNGDAVIECATEDKTKCMYQQTDPEDTFPKLISLSSTDTDLIMTGTGFYSVGYTASVTWMGFEASSVAIDSAEQVTATFDGGLPIVTKVDQSFKTERPSLYFKPNDGSEVVF